MVLNRQLYYNELEEMILEGVEASINSIITS